MICMLEVLLLLLLVLICMLAAVVVPAVSTSLLVPQVLQLEPAQSLLVLVVQEALPARVALSN